MSDLHPPMGRKLHDAFLALQPTIYLREKGLLYRPHVVELLGRVIDGKDLQDPTAAEQMGLLADASLAAPMTSPAAGLYFRLFRKLFPAVAERWVSNAEERFEAWGSYPGDVEELRETLRKKMRREIGAVAGRG